MDPISEEEGTVAGIETPSLAVRKQWECVNKDLPLLVTQ